MDIQPYNPQFLKWMRTYNAMRGLDLSCRYADWVEEDLPDICPNCGESCELNGDAVCYECEIDPSRGEKGEEETEDVCDCCGGSGTIYAMRPNSWYGMMEVPVKCDCVFPAAIPYDVRQLAIEQLSGLNWV